MVSGRGSQGGYRLARPAADYTAGEILRAIEGELTSIPCLASTAEQCPRRSLCRTLGFWAGMNQVINQYADSVTLEDLRRAPRRRPCCEAPRPFTKQAPRPFTKLSLVLRGANGV